MSNPYILRTEKVEALPSRVDTLLLDIYKPIGLSIYHDGLVSHVCTINTADGSTVFHRCVRKGDNYRIMELLLKIDDTCINIQNSSGLTPLHLACQLDRRHCVDKLLGCVEVDLNILTLDGNLPEEMTNNEHIIKALQRCRKGVKQLQDLVLLHLQMYQPLVNQSELKHRPPST